MDGSFNKHAGKNKYTEDFSSKLSMEEAILET
jgi:hypothetical protein